MSPCRWSSPAARDAFAARARPGSTRSGSRRARRITRPAFGRRAAARRAGARLRARPACCWPTSPPAISTATPARQVIDLLFALNAERGTTLLLITHDPALAERCGRIAAHGGRAASSTANGSGSSRLALACALARRELRGGLRRLPHLPRLSGAGRRRHCRVGSLRRGRCRAHCRGARRCSAATSSPSSPIARPPPTKRAFLAAAARVATSSRCAPWRRRWPAARAAWSSSKAVDRRLSALWRGHARSAAGSGDALGQARRPLGRRRRAGLLDRLGLISATRSASAMRRLFCARRHRTEPDASAGSFALGPRLLIARRRPGRDRPRSSRAALIAIALSLCAWRRAASVAAFATPCASAIPRCRLAVPRRSADAAPRLQRLLDRMTMFLTLVGLTTLLVGGVGVGQRGARLSRRKHRHHRHA